MKKGIVRIASAFALLLLLGQTAYAQRVRQNVIDEVVWLVGDEPILLSDIEYQKMRLRSEGHRFDGNPDCLIPEQLALQKLFLNQAKIDSVEVSEQQVNRYVDSWIENAIRQIGSQEKLEEYFGKKLNLIKEDERKEVRNAQIVNSMRQKITESVQVSPSEIRKFFQTIPQDSLPFVPKTVEVEIISVRPQVDLAEIDRIKARLREFSDEITAGKRDFSVLARLYSENKTTARQGGEYGFVGRAALETEFASVVFNLSDPKRVSQIVKTEDGYHIVQLIEKRGDLVNFRHILLRPEANDLAVVKASERMDSITKLINEEKLTFAQAAEMFSDDKDSRANGGLMTNRNQESDFDGSAFFRYEDLPQDIARIVSRLKVGEISAPFRMRQSNGQEDVVVVRLKREHAEHVANLNTDYRTIKTMALNKKREQVIEDWIRRKQKETPIVIREQYSDCAFRYPGWVRKE